MERGLDSYELIGSFLECSTKKPESLTSIGYIDRLPILAFPLCTKQPTIHLIINLWVGNSRSTTMISLKKIIIICIIIIALLIVLLS
jgi:hypothetical protein